jgi:flagellar assembly protein FliH
VLRGGRADAAAPLSFPAIAMPAWSSRGVGPGGRGFDPEEVERARLDAAAHGYADGFATGRDEAVAAMRSVASGLLAELDAAVRSHAAREQQALDTLTDGVVDFALQVVEAILGRELELAAQPARDAIRRALRIAPDRGPVAVRLHPSELELLEDLDEVLGGRTVELVGDTGIEPGGCVAHVDGCVIDAQLGPALERVREVLGR